MCLVPLFHRVAQCHVKQKEVNAPQRLMFEEEPPLNRSPLHQLSIFKFIQYRHAKERKRERNKNHAKAAPDGMYVYIICIYIYIFSMSNLFTK